ncbi:MAG: long-chain fatty acid--CoA ligase [Bacteroidales bacterium]|jgi:long-chain acyl-CoA synthetase|nr:long-chain fatty acid--CoA ligase [Bacteroidales bacterium]
MEVTRLFDILDNYLKKFPKEDALAGKENGVWIKYSTEAYVQNVNDLSYGLMQLGIKKGDKIATITPNRPEWNFLDMAILQLGAVHVPIYPTISESDYEHILKHAEVKMVFVAGWELLRKIEHILPNIPTLNKEEMVYTFKNLRDYKHLSEIIELGKANPSPEYLQQIKDSIDPHDVATMIYTSGTTGLPKGVMLSHNNILSNAIAISPIPPVGPEGKALSYLPLCHIYERMINYAWQYLGFSIYYAESLATIADNIKEIRPQLVTTVPRLLEKIYDKIILTGRKQKWLKRKIFFWANSLALDFELEGKSWWYGKKLAVARKLVLSKWKAALGGNIKVIVSGGAALQPRLARVFWAAEVPILEGYGLTETSPVIAVSNFDENGIKFGTVGPPLSNVEVKIAHDGEILCKGPSIMLGYYKDDELTKEVIDDDGWFHTGDLGVIEPEGQLKITGRKKEMFKTAFGKYVVPTLIESKFCESPFIDTMMVVGENEKFAAAIIVPDFIDLRNWCTRKGIEYTTNGEMVKNPDVIKRYKKEVAKYNALFGDTEQIKNFALMDYEWTVQTGELTPTLKLKRGFISEKHADVIERLFDPNGSRNK